MYTYTGSRNVYDIYVVETSEMLEQRNGMARDRSFTERLDHQATYIPGMIYTEGLIEENPLEF